MGGGPGHFGQSYTKYYPMKEYESKRTKNWLVKVNKYLLENVIEMNSHLHGSWKMGKTSARILDSRDVATVCLSHHFLLRNCTARYQVVSPDSSSPRLSQFAEAYLLFFKPEKREKAWKDSDCTCANQE